MYDFFIDHTLVSLKDSIVPGGPEAFGDRVIFNRYPIFIDTLNNDFQLAPCSPAINKGDNTVAAGFSMDLNGAQRIQNEKIDLGAYETADSCSVKTLEITPTPDVLISPNPVKAGEEFNLIFDNTRQSIQGSGLPCTLFDPSGKMVQETLLQTLSGEFRLKAPEKGGIYFLRIGQNRYGKLLKMIVLSP